MERKYAARNGAGIISVETGPIPEPGHGEILVKVKASLISSGTELGGVKRQRENPSSKEPSAFGYQNAGDIIKLGSGCEEFQVGDRVACMGGGYALHTSHACVPKNLSIHIPEGLSYEEAAFNHLGATAVQAIRRGKLELAENVVVVGLGLVGQLTCQLARISGAHVMGVDRFPLRLKTARNLGADVVANAETEDVVKIANEFTRGYGMDCGFICFGGDGNEAFKKIVQMMKKSPDTHVMGRVVIVGGATVTHSFGASLGNMDIRSSARTGPGYHDDEYEHGKNYPPVFVQWSTKRNLEETLRFIQEGRLNVKSLISHEYPLDKAQEACENIVQTPEKTLGVILMP